MNKFELQARIATTHLTEHIQHLPLTERDISCETCYIKPKRNKLTQQFNHFWYWVYQYENAQTFNSYTTTAFEAYLEEFKQEDPEQTTVSLQLSTRSFNTLLSIRYHPVPRESKRLHLYFLNLTKKTDYFNNPVTEELIENLRPLVHQELNKANKPPTELPPPIEPPENLGNMAEDLQTAFEAVFGANATNLTNVLKANNTALTQALANNAPNAGPKEQNLIKIEPYHGRDDEDPHEWMELFAQAAVTNRWQGDRRIEIATGYLRDAARDWFARVRNTITTWDDAENQDASFIPRFIAEFSTVARQNKWYNDLVTLRQLPSEMVDDYSRKFKKLVRKVRTTAELPPPLQIRMFLIGLNPIITPLVAIQNPETLDATITKAKAVESGYQYTPGSQMPVQATVPLTNGTPATVAAILPFLEEIQLIINLQ